MTGTGTRPTVQGTPSSRRAAPLIGAGGGKAVRDHGLPPVAAGSVLPLGGHPGETVSSYAGGGCGR